jgi:3-oxoacyl-[acyl-carrier-protein] synthase II
LVYKRVVVTGLGAVTPIGLNTEDYWQGLIQGKNGIGPITAFDVTRFSVKLAGEVKGFNPELYMPLKRIDRSSRVIQFAIAATQMAVKQAKLTMSSEKPERVGVIIATGGMVAWIGEQNELIKTRGPNRVDPLTVAKVGPNMVAVQVGMEIGARGPNTTLNSACASGSDSLGEALNHIQLGHADVRQPDGADLHSSCHHPATNIVGQ